MSTELLKTFLAVSQTRHFGRAAESLYLTQSAVSSRIGQLEHQLGADLFTRHRNNIRLTSAGKRLLPYAESLINTWQLAKKEVSCSSQYSELSMGAIASLWETRLTPWLQSLYQQHKTLQLEAHIARRHNLAKQLYERQLDLFITTEFPKMDKLASQSLGHFSLRLYSSANRDKTKKMPYIKLEWSNDFHQQKSKILGDKPILTTTSAHMARQLLDTTGGCAFLPDHWGEKYPQLHPETSAIPCPLYAVWLQNSDQQALIKRLLETPIHSVAQE